MKKIVFKSEPCVVRDLSVGEMFSAYDAQQLTDLMSKAAAEPQIGVSVFIRTNVPYPKNKMDHEKVNKITYEVQDTEG